MAGAFPKASQIDALLRKSEGLELNIKAEKALKMLLDNKVSYYVTEKPDAFLVHPSNGGGLMLNPYDVHDKGSTMLKVGAQLSKLYESEQGR